MERLLRPRPYQLWMRVWLFSSARGEGVEQDSCGVQGGQVGTFPSRVRAVRAAGPGAHAEWGLSTCRKRPPQESGSSGEPPARPQAPRHAGQEGQARRWAGLGGPGSPGKGQPGLAPSLEPAAREARGSAGGGRAGPGRASLPWWAGRQPRRGRGSPWSHHSSPGIGAGLAPCCQPLPGLKRPARRRRGESGKASDSGRRLLLRSPAPVAPGKPRRPDGAEASPRPRSGTPGRLRLRASLPPPPPPPPLSGRAKEKPLIAPPKCLSGTLAGLISFYG